MNDQEEYKLRWRGRETGPFSVPEINRQLDEHEIGTGHEIFYQNDWITLEEFLTASQEPPAPAQVPEPLPLPLPPPLPSASAPLHLKPSPARIKVSVSREKPELPRAKTASAASGPRPRHRLLFAFLAVVAGFLGAHNFYARQWLTGLLQLLLSVATCIMGFGIIASWLWAMAEAVFVRKDGDGVDMI